MSSRVASAITVCFLSFPVPLFAQGPVDLAAGLIGRPYVWGAEGPRAFDCSGLMQYVHRRVGITLPRRAIDQSRVGAPVGRRLQRGDLLFFASDTRKSLVTHVGIYEGDGAMIDASKRYGRVRRDNLNDRYWVERFMFARRIGDGRDAGDVARPGRSGDRRRAAIRVLGHIAELLLRRRQ